MSLMETDADQSIAIEDFGISIMDGRIKREHLIHILDGIDREVESLRKQAIDLQEKRDQLHTRIDLLRTDYFVSQVDELDPDFDFYLKRVNDRIKTINVNVKTIRDDEQVESVHKINNIIDHVIKIDDPIEKRRKCQEYLNSCSSSVQYSEIIVVDKKFETHLLSCTLDDQKLIKKRLEALMHYMLKQMVSE